MYRFTDGNIHDVDFFENKFDKLTITEENFEKEKSKCLYQITELTYPEDLEMIKFRYYTPDNQLIEQENVPVVYDGEKGEKGEKGESGQQGTRGARYLGSFASNADKSPAGVSDTVHMDFYLSKTDNTIYQKNGVTWLACTFNDYPSLYKQAIGDCMELAKTSGEASYAAVAFITNLFAGNIKATGSIRVGERYNENGNVVKDVAGAYLGNNGVLKANRAELDNIQATGGVFNNVEIQGEIDTPIMIKDGGYMRQRGGLRAFAFFSYTSASGLVIKYKSENIKNITRLYEGTYLIEFTDFAYMSYVLGTFAYTTHYDNTKPTWVHPTKGDKMSYVYVDSGHIIGLNDYKDKGYAVIQCHLNSNDSLQDPRQGALCLFYF